LGNLKELLQEFKLELLAESSCQAWTWEKWHQECLRRFKHTLKKSTLVNYDGRLKKWIPGEMNEMKLNDINTKYIHNLVFNSPKFLETGDYTKRNILKLIKRIFQVAVDEGVLEQNPCKGIKVQVTKRQLTVLNSKEASLLLETSEDCNHRFHQVWTFALFTGMRSGEMYALRWQDVDFVTKAISVNKQWTSKDGLGPTKTKENRIVPISDELLSFLKKIKLESDNHTETFWDNRSSKEVTFGDLVLPRLGEWKHGDQAKVLRDFCDGIGITSVRFHDLRATFITNMLAQGVPLVKVMHIVGHKKMSTTDGYVRQAGVGLEGVTNQIGYKIPKGHIGVTEGKVVNLFGE